MNHNWQIHNYDPSAKIWIYTIHPSISLELKAEFEKDLGLFCDQWTAHNKELRSFFKIINEKILVLGVDEHLNPASGCSIDKSVHFLEDLEKKYQIDLFNRMLFTYVDENDLLNTNTKMQFENLLSENKINSHTKVVNTLALTIKDWNENGVIALEKSWMINFFNIAV